MTSAAVRTAAVLLVLASAACSANQSSPSRPSAVAVTAGETTCEVATTTLPAGRHTFEISNTGGQVTEVYVYGTADRIMGEQENIGPATKRTMIVDLPAGAYQVACKPGMVGTGHRTALTVTGAPASAAVLDANLTSAVASYRTYVESETRALVDATATFTAAIGAGDLARAKQAYPPARLHYERIEPIAESFGDLDPLIDMRADDATDGTAFAGFHAVEQQLFQKGTLTGTPALATALSANIAKLNDLVKTVEITPLTMGNGAKSLLDEVAKSKVTGEEERYSRIDLVDFSGNVDGARCVYTALRPALLTKNATLVSTLDARFAALIGLLDTHRATPGTPGYLAGSPYVSYDALSPAAVKALAVEVDAISEPLGRISAAVTTR